MKNYLRAYFALALAMLVCLLFIDLPIGFLWDVKSYARWNAVIKEYGLQFAYEHKVDYPPTMVYLLALKSLFYSSYDSILIDYKSLKIITFLFSIINGYLIYLIVGIIQPVIHTKSKIIPFLYLLNPGILFNTLIWGQVDEIAVFFILLTLFLFITRRIYFGILVFVLMVNFKIQSIITLPFVIMAYLFYIKKAPNKFILSFSHLLYGFMVVVVLYAPFLINHQMYRLKAVIGFVDSFPRISMNAYNLWYLMIDNPTEKLDNSIFKFALTYKQVGLLLFFGSCGLMLGGYFLKQLKTIKPDLKLFFALFSMANLMFYFVLTQMHERYSHFAFFSLLITFGVYNKKQYLWIYLLLSLAYLMNLADVMQISYANVYDFNFEANERLVSLIYFLGIALLIFQIIVELRIFPKRFYCKER